MSLHVEWNSAKASVNERKHGVSFLEAATVLGDPLSVILPDRDHSRGEDRSLLLGRSSSGRLLVVVISEAESAVRIISARPMTARERREYEQGTA
jgi:uncharacterized DUF497 family protein